MYFRKAGQSQAEGAAAHIEKLQFDLVISSSYYSVFAAALAALTQYLFVNQNFVAPILDFWITCSLVVYFIGYLLLSLFARSKEKKRADYDIARQILYAFVIALGLLWGASGLVLIPSVDAHAQLIVLILTMAVATEIASTLFYRYKVAISFIVLVIVPMMIGVYISDGIATLTPLVVITLLAFYLMIMIRSAMNTGRSVEKILIREAQSLQRERELRGISSEASQVNRDKSKFIANMSHEMRTPMHAVLGFSDLGTKKSTSVSRDKLHDYFMRINESGRILLNFLDQLIDLSNLEAGRSSFKIEKNDMRSTIESAIEQIKTKIEERSVRVEVKSKLDSTMAYYDKEKLKEALINLLYFSLKSTPTDSVISIIIEEARLPSLLSAAVQNSRSAMSVSIVAPGVSRAEKEMAIIFDELAQSNKKTTGIGDSDLGLSISKEIIQQHNGVITAHNDTAAGAILMFTIPIGGQYETTREDAFTE